MKERKFHQFYGDFRIEWSPGYMLYKRMSVANSVVFSYVVPGAIFKINAPSTYAGSQKCDSVLNRQPAVKCNWYL